MQKLGRWKRYGAWRALLIAVLWLPAAASATVFSFGTVNPTDVISSLTFVPSVTKTSFDPGTNTMHIEAYLSQINFSNRPPITGIAPNTVLLTSDIMLVSLTVTETFVGSNNPNGYTATFTNGMVDLGIYDTISLISVLDTDYDGGLDHSVTEPSIGFLNGQLSADIDTLASGDADFRSAFGLSGSMDANFSSFLSDGSTPPAPPTGAVGRNICNLVKLNTTVYTNAAQTCGPGYGLDDFTTNANITIIPNPIPEPGSALLLGLGLAGVAALRRK